jgi:hypothetical protein
VKPISIREGEVLSIDGEREGELLGGRVATGADNNGDQVWARGENWLSELRSYLVREPCGSGTIDWIRLDKDLDVH